jgi:hypothetical protein
MRPYATLNEAQDSGLTYHQSFINPWEKAVFLIDFVTPATGCDSLMHLGTANLPLATR